jgi:electron-transferring-flavoprotein dehydrogenase
MSSAPVLLVAGFGDLGARVAAQRIAAGAQVVALRRRAIEAAGSLRGVRADLASGDGLFRLPREVEAVLYCVAPDTRVEAAYRALYHDGLRRLLDRVDTPRVLFVSSTAVYAQDLGEWVDEDSAAAPASFNGRVLLEGEAVARSHPGGGIMRLSGLYGPGRDALVRRARDGRASARRWSNRIHVEDAASAANQLLAATPARAASTWLASDDAPALECEVQDWVREREGLPPVPAEAGVASGRRIGNARLRGLGWVPAYPDFRAGYAALMGAGV